MSARESAAGIARSQRLACKAHIALVLLAAPLLPFALAPGCDEADSPPPPEPAAMRPNVVLYVVDTLRADAIGAYGGSDSPRIDAFASDAVVFERAYAQSSWTRSAVASLFTGLWPANHGVHGRDHALSTELVTLAERMKRAGYVTAAFSTNSNIGAALEFDQGFDLYRELVSATHRDSLHRLSDEVNDAVFAWLDSEPVPPEPFLLYVHVVDPHAPYVPIDDGVRSLRERYRPSEDEHRALVDARERLGDRIATEVSALVPGSILWMQALASRQLQPNSPMLAILTSLYASEVAFVDEQFGALLDGLRARGLYDQSLVVFTSDHGEEFYEHGQWEHGFNLHDTSIRIPLIVRPPHGERSSGRVDDRVARQVDIVPTILAALSEPVTGLDGTSLLSDEATQVSVAQLELDNRRSASLVDWPWKLIARSAPTKMDALYRLDRDPHESEDLSDRHPERAERMKASLQARLETGRNVSATVTLSDEHRRRLEAMGYIEPAQVVGD